VRLQQVGAATSHTFPTQLVWCLK